jgi:hypothetical protein
LGHAREPLLPVGRAIDLESRITERFGDRRS